MQDMTALGSALLWKPRVDARREFLSVLARRRCQFGVDVPGFNQIQPGVYVSNRPSESVWLKPVLPGPSTEEGT